MTKEPLQTARDELVTLLDATSRHVDILSPALEPALFDNDDVVAALTRLARRGRQTRIRILIAGLEPAQFQGHRLLALARRLTTAISVHVLAAHPEWNRETVVLCDRCSGLLVVPEDKRIRRIDDKPYALRWSETFDRLWLAGSESPELRQF